eukprot:TRINITY_DN3302_c0_g1_i2.p1 TRINITY_DN3302_c0_g1~~TRINITY_DN3302_c0_g1_i2.p1  ORF type:complete len:430 (+),score=53.14 TRINITY_DN3302_c0_g1_i2:473-1762(+)
MTTHSANNSPVLVACSPNADGATSHSPILARKRKGTSLAITTDSPNASPRMQATGSVTNSPALTSTYIHCPDDILDLDLALHAQGPLGHSGFTLDSSSLYHEVALKSPKRVRFTYSRSTPTSSPNIDKENISNHVLSNPLPIADFITSARPRRNYVARRSDDSEDDDASEESLDEHDERLHADSSPDSVSENGQVDGCHDSFSGSEDSHGHAKDLHDQYQSVNCINYHSGTSCGDTGYDESEEAAADANSGAGVEAEVEEEEVDEFDPYEFMRTLPPVPSEYVNRLPCIPQRPTSSPPVTLVLDLDETLVHCSTEPMDDCNHTFPVVFGNHEFLVHARIRPYCSYFLEQVSRHFEVVIFTASQRVYADKILNILDPHGHFIRHRVFRDDCVYVNGNYVKDLTVLGRDMSQTIIIDNSPQAFSYQVRIHP